MKLKLASIALAAAALVALAGCAPSNTGTAQEPKPMSEFLSYGSYIDFEDGQTLPCYSTSSYGAFSCDWSEIENADNLVLREGSKYNLHYVNTSSGVAPCIERDKDYRNGQVSCGFGLVKR